VFIVTFLLLFRQQERIHISEICLLLYIYIRQAHVGGINTI